MVRFFKTSVACKAIKYILSQTALPLYKTITSDELIMEGCIYVYKDKLIRCTSSGRFDGLNSSLSYDDHLYVNDHIILSDNIDSIQRRGQIRQPKGNFDIANINDRVSHITEDEEEIPIQKANPEGIGNLKRIPHSTEYYDDYLTVTDDVVRQFYRPFAEYEIIQDFYFGQFEPGLSYYHISNSNYYDTETHYYLGEYLRCLRDIKGIDLMCLYNCFTYKYVDNVYINKNSKSYLSDVLPKDKKVTLVPIKFNKTYTIATSCNFKVDIKSILYKDELMKTLDGEHYICEELHESFKSFNNLQFETPKTYTITTDRPEILEYEKYLYLAIQVPENLESPIVVLEGDYTSHADKHVSDVASIEHISDAQLSKIFKSKLSLLVNDGIQRPFSNVLLEYLFENTIDSREYIDENINTIQNKINYKPVYEGQWSNTLRYILYTKYMNSKAQGLNKLDILGFVDSKIEEAVHKGLIVNG